MNKLTLGKKWVIADTSMCYSQKEQQKAHILLTGQARKWLKKSGQNY